MMSYVKKMGIIDEIARSLGKVKGETWKCRVFSCNHVHPTYDSLLKAHPSFNCGQILSTFANYEPKEIIAFNGGRTSIDLVFNLRISEELTEKKKERIDLAMKDAFERDGVPVDMAIDVTPDSGVQSNFLRKNKHLQITSRYLVDRYMFRLADMGKIFECLLCPHFESDRITVMALNVTVKEESYILTYVLMNVVVRIGACKGLQKVVNVYDSQEEHRDLDGFYGAHPFARKVVDALSVVYKIYGPCFRVEGKHLVMELNVSLPSVEAFVGKINYLLGVSWDLIEKRCPGKPVVVLSSTLMLVSDISPGKDKKTILREIGWLGKLSKRVIEQTTAKVKFSLVQDPIIRNVARYKVNIYREHPLRQID